MGDAVSAPQNNPPKPETKPCGACGAPSAPSDWLCGPCRISAESRLAELTDPHNVRGYVQEMRDLGLWDDE